jgi:hypothetical protein
MRVRKLPVIIGLLFLVLAVFSWGALRKYQLDESSRETTVRLLEHALSNSSAEELVNHAHAQWLQSMPAESIRSYLNFAFDRLGPLQAMTSITGESTAGMLPDPGETVDASYIVTVVMGEAAFETEVDLRYENGQWLITNLFLNTPALME